MNSSRYANLTTISRLDPERDHQRIAYLSASFDFPWDTQKAYELALIRTFAVPKSSKLLVSTGEFTKRTQKRYDDTTIIISTIGLYGYDSPEGRAAIKRMNQMHGRYRIPNEEFLFVLSTFVFEPIYWNTKYGWRPLSEQEKQAAYYYWREVGRRMNIKDIPDSLENFERFKLAYEHEHFAYSPANQQLAEVTRDLFLSWYLPKPLWGLGNQLIYALMDAPMRQAFGFPEARLWAKWLVYAGLKTRAFVLRFLPARRKPYVLSKIKTYPEGYKLEEVGV